MKVLKNILIILFSIIILGRVQAVEPKAKHDVQIEDGILQEICLLLSDLSEIKGDWHPDIPDEIKDFISGEI